MQRNDMTLFRVVGTVLVHWSGMFLITKRSSNLKVFPGQWTIPGGGLEKSDYESLPNDFQPGQWYRVLEKATRRELLEETGLEVGKLRLVTDLVFMRPDGIPVLTFTYTAQYVKGDVKLNGECTEHAWVSIKDLHLYQLIPGIAQEIKDAANLYSSIT